MVAPWTTKLAADKPNMVAKGSIENLVRAAGRSPLASV
jgi:hypothetical protein